MEWMAWNMWVRFTNSNHPDFERAEGFGFNLGEYYKPLKVTLSPERACYVLRTGEDSPLFRLNCELFDIDWREFFALPQDSELVAKYHPEQPVEGDVSFRASIPLKGEQFVRVNMGVEDMINIYQVARNALDDMLKEGRLSAEQASRYLTEEDTRCDGE